MSLVDDRFEQERRVKVAKAAVRSRKHLREVDADIGGDENLRVALARLDEYLDSEPHYVLVALRQYFAGSDVKKASYALNLIHWGLS